MDANGAVYQYTVNGSYESNLLRVCWLLGVILDNYTDGAEFVNQFLICYANYDLIRHNWNVCSVVLNSQTWTQNPPYFPLFRLGYSIYSPKVMSIKGISGKYCGLFTMLNRPASRGNVSPGGNIENRTFSRIARFFWRFFWN